MARAAKALGLAIRVGCHTGEVVMVAGNARGIAVHTAARVMALAGAGEVLVSSPTRELLSGSGINLEPAGTFELKGLTGQHDVYRVRPQPA
jgi:class 3 adenylate cyclase